jgi:hypothetical protein
VKVVNVCEASQIRCWRIALDDQQLEDNRYTDVPNAYLLLDFYLKNVVLWDVTRVTLVRTDVSEERFPSIIRRGRISELGTTLTVKPDLWHGRKEI